MQLCRVVIDVQTKALDSAYAYKIPENLDVRIGSCVVVSFNRRYSIGFVIDVYEDEPAFKVLPVLEVVSKPYFTPLQARCAEFISKRYVAPLSACVRLLIPKGAVPKVAKSSTEDKGYKVVAPKIAEVEVKWVTRGKRFNEFVPRRNAIKQIAILGAISRSDMQLRELNCLFAGAASTIGSLVKKEVLDVYVQRDIRSAISQGSASQSEDRVALNEHQRKALAKIGDAASQEDGSVVLIDGVTGSGKTEIYLCAIEETLKRNKRAIVLVPEISLTPQTVSRFRARFGDKVGVIHSKMSQGERYDQWDLIREGVTEVVIGARSALFSPIDNLGLIVIDEEHETTYKQESSPRYVSRDVASWMVRQVGGALVLGSATPSIEALYLANKLGSWTHVEIKERTNKKPLPKIEVIDMTAQPKGKIFSRQLERAMKEELALGHKVVLLLNQRGFARFLMCHECGFVPECNQCSTTLTYHEVGNKLVCHHCGNTLVSPSVCPSCKSPYLMRYGVGTQRVEDELRSILAGASSVSPEFVTPSYIEGHNAQGPEDIDGLYLDGDFSDVEVIRMDADSTSKKNAHEMLLEQFAKSARAVLLGTQMIAKGLDFDDVTIVGVINADTQLHLPDFRSYERTFDLIEQVAGRAGRGDLPGRVLVQTYECENEAIQAAAHYDRDRFLRYELPKRKMLKFPPYVRMANILAWSKDSASAKRVIGQLHETLANAIADDQRSQVELTDAVPCVLERVRNRYRWHFVLKAPLDEDISSLLYESIGKRKSESDVNVAIDVDPIDLL